MPLCSPKLLRAQYMECLVLVAVKAVAVDLEPILAVVKVAAVVQDPALVVASAEVVALTQVQQPQKPQPQLLKACKIKENWDKARYHQLSWWYFF